MNKKRIEYIDALRGFTMILVVFSHVILFSFQFDNSFVNDIFISFRMPLFFFISGFIGYKAGVEWTGRTWWAMSRKKLMVQLIPTFFFGLIYAYAYLNSSFTAFITHEHKYGYWFTIVLLEMFLLLYAMNLVSYQIDKKDSSSRKLIVLVFISIISFLTRFKYMPSIDPLLDVLSLRLLFRYFPFFAFGYICSMYRNTFNKIIESRYFSAVNIALFASLFYVGRTYLCPAPDIPFYITFLDVSVDVIVGFLGLLIVYNTFKIYADSFTSDKKIGSALQYIGKRTLDIYLLHYFFIPYLPQVGRMLEQGNNAALELALGGCISLLVIGLCLVVSNIIRTSPILAKYLFGVKSNH